MLAGELQGMLKANPPMGDTRQGIAAELATVDPRADGSVCNVEEFGQLAGGEVTMKRVSGRGFKQLTKPLKGSNEPVVIPEGMTPTICPSGKDHRFTVDKLPEGFASQLSANDCRPWAAAVCAGS